MPGAERTVLVYRAMFGAPSEPWLVTQHADLPGWRALWVSHGATADAGRLAARHGLSSERVTISRWGTPMLRRTAFVAGRDPVVTRHVRRWRPDVLHAHFGPDGAAAMATATRFDLPLVVSFHGYDASRSDAAFTTRGGRWWLRHRAELFDRAAVLLANSGYTAERLVALGADPGRVQVHHLGVDTASLTPPDAPRRTDEVLFVGRLVEVKGIEIAVRAMAQVCSTVPHARLTVIGDGPLAEPMRRLAASSGVQATWCGAADTATVHAAMRRATVLCGPSTVAPDGQREAFGLVFAEAQTCGLPVVASRSGGIPDAVADGVGGLLADEGDVEGTAARLMQVLTDAALRERLGAAGRAFAVERFDLRRRSTALAAVYDRVSR